MPFWNHKRLFMNKKNYVNCIDEHLCNALLVELRTLETKCDRVIAELSEVKKKIAFRHRLSCQFDRTFCIGDA